MKRTRYHWLWYHEPKPKHWRVKARWRYARQPHYDDHPAVVTDKDKVVWWLAVKRWLK